jgi:hypothetical protein
MRLFRAVGCDPDLRFTQEYFQNLLADFFSGLQLLAPFGSNGGGEDAF